MVRWNKAKITHRLDQVRSIACDNPPWVPPLLARHPSTDLLRVTLPHPITAVHLAAKETDIGTEAALDIGTIITIAAALVVTGIKSVATAVSTVAAALVVTGI